MNDVRICPECSKAVSREDMLLTRDCHGTPFKLVCPKCYDKMMEKGYAGEYYTELDECIDPDY